MIDDPEQPKWFNKLMRSQQSECEPPVRVQPVVRGHRRFFTCAYHGWDALGSPCPKCMAGDAPKRCEKHGWASNTGCPKCKSGYDA